jgi:hypothetical protein
MLTANHHRATIYLMQRLDQQRQFLLPASQKIYLPGSPKRSWKTGGRGCLRSAIGEYDWGATTNLQGPPNNMPNDLRRRTQTALLSSLLKQDLLHQRREKHNLVWHRMWSPHSASTRARTPLSPYLYPPALPDQKASGWRRTGPRIMDTMLEPWNATLFEALICRNCPGENFTVN